jgi:hypothetical protein
MPGLPGTCSYSDVQQIKADIQREMEALVYRLVNETCSNNKIVPETCNNSNTDCPEDFGMISSKPSNSCHQIYQCNPLTPSGRYWIQTVDGDGYQIQQMFCEMEAQYNGLRGWTRVAYINMTKDGAQCPTNLRTITSPKNLCTRRVSSTASCSSVTFPTEGLRYSKICGQAVGYQYASMDTFAGPKDINSYYVNGMSITYGSPRKHVWTYAVGLSDDGNYAAYNCPCAKVPGPAPPSFVSDHYYCESGNTGAYENKLHANDPLWDGAGCGAGNNCCTQPGMPWFCRILPREVEEDIEVRICASSGITNEDLHLELLAIYIQ